MQDGISPLEYLDGNDSSNNTLSSPPPPPPPQILLWLFHHSENTPLEATGLSLNSFARGAVGMSTLFLGPALLVLAKEAAAASAVQSGQSNREEGIDENNDEGRVYGMRPTSLLTNIGIFSNLFSILLLPLFGAIVDHTPHRKAVGQFSAILLSLIKGLEVFVSRSTWFLVAFLQVVNFVLYNAHLCAVYAYTAELSTNSAEQTTYNSKFQGINYISMLIFLIILILLSTIFQTDDIGTARISQTMAFLACTTVFSLSWKFFFRQRPALRKVPEHSTLFASGFEKLTSTFFHIYSNHQWYALRYFLLSIMLSEGATAALSTISTTYLTHVLEMNAHQIGKAFLCVFVAGIPGSKLGGWVGVTINPLRSALLCLVVFMANTTLAAVFMKGPETSAWVIYVFCAIWGVCLGWLHPTHAALYCTIIPRGQESELMGVYIFSGALLAWLPPFVFTLLNELGASMSIGLASLNVFFAGGFVFLLCIGDYWDAVGFALVRGREDDVDYAVNSQISSRNNEKKDLWVGGVQHLPEIT